MVRINFHTTGGQVLSVDAQEDETVMYAAVNAGIDGIVGDCGGNLSCATCHAYISPDFQKHLPPPSEMELTMLDCALHVTDDSRLTCQIKLTAALDGMVVTIPPLE